MPNVSQIPFRVDQEFRALIPPLSAEEYALLEASVQQEGCRDPLVIWFIPGSTAWCDRCEAIYPLDCHFGYMYPEFEDDPEKEWFVSCTNCQRPLMIEDEADHLDEEDLPCMLLDGHHRLEICERLNIDYSTIVLWGLKTRKEAHLWMLQNQLGRRNLSDIDRVALALQLKPLLAEQAKRQQGMRTDLLPNLVESTGTTTQEEIAQIAGVSHGTVYKAERILDKGAAEIIQAARDQLLSLHAALPLTDLPREQQETALQDATRDAEGKKPTAIQTRAAVSRIQVVATVKEHLAAGKTPQQAVSHALQQHEITLPTPGLADAICAATDRQVTLAASDGFLHDGRTKAEEVATAAQTRRMFQLFNALEGLATLPDLSGLIAEIPAYSAYRVDQYLEVAVAKLTEFIILWKERADDTGGSPR